MSPYNGTSLNESSHNYLIKIGPPALFHESVHFLNFLQELWKSIFWMFLAQKSQSANGTITQKRQCRPKLGFVAEPGQPASRTAHPCSCNALANCKPFLTCNHTSTSRWRFSDSCRPRSISYLPSHFRWRTETRRKSGAEKDHHKREDLSWRWDSLFYGFHVVTVNLWYSALLLGCITDSKSTLSLWRVSKSCHQNPWNLLRRANLHLYLSNASSHSPPRFFGLDQRDEIQRHLRPSSCSTPLLGH